MQRGQVRQQQGDVEGALADYAEALTLNPDNPTALLRRARLLLDAGQVDAAELLRAAVPEGATLAALDERGTRMDSRQFADRIAAWRAGGRDLAFVIGGADGLDAGLLAGADVKLSLGSMTWPHMMVRVMLMEQLYRAQQILAGHPYHKS